jgi:hypothetical protein
MGVISLQQLMYKFELFSVMQPPNAGQFLLPIVQGFGRIVEGFWRHFQRKFEGCIPVFASRFKGLQKGRVVKGLGICG